MSSISLTELINETCPICSDNLFLGKPYYPIEINNCHHKFHKKCLLQWCNNYQKNTLVSCSCPTCRQTFNSTNCLKDLNSSNKQDLLKSLVNGDYNNLTSGDKEKLQKIINENNQLEQPVTQTVESVTQIVEPVAIRPSAPVAMRPSIASRRQSVTVRRPLITVRQSLQPGNGTYFNVFARQRGGKITKKRKNIKKNKKTKKYH